MRGGIEPIRQRLQRRSHSQAPVEVVVEVIDQPNGVKAELVGAAMILLDESGALERLQGAMQARFDETNLSPEFVQADAIRMSRKRLEHKQDTVRARA